MLEAGFDDVTPNTTKDIGSWVYYHAVSRGVDIIDNRAKAVPCYDPGYTLVEAPDHFDEVPAAASQ